MSVRKLTPAIKKQLDVIADHLWNAPSNACAFVGAGMSMNAIRKDITTLRSPGWSELANKMISQLPEGWKINRNFQSVLKIAEMYVASYGRDKMNRFLEESIPDDELEPSELHEKFLELPWRDIFTTNYDTLLERAADRIGGGYTYINSQDEISNSISPRIIKLHGSFSTGGDYVISEEDYRKYPAEKAIFVSTVRQSLIENTFCLFGFSGDDPNFINGIGWVQDQFKNAKTNIYIIGWNFDESTRILWKNRKICLIDLAPICPTIAEFGVALMEIVEYLQSKNPRDINWEVDSLLDKKRRVVYSRLKKKHDEYRGWYLAPHDTREQIVRSLYEADDKIVEALLANPNNIQLAYYVNWLWEKAALPLFDNYVDIFAKIVTETELTIKKGDKEKWRALVLALIRAYRERGNEEQWHVYCEMFNRYIKGVSRDHKSRYYYELCLFDIIGLNFKELHEHIEAWGKYSMPEIWRAKRAALIAEYFDIKEARGELKKALATYQKRNAKELHRHDIRCESTYVIIMFLLGRINAVEKLVKWEIPSKEDSFREKLRESSKYGCNPIDEIVYLEQNLRPHTHRDNVETLPSFDISRVNQSHHFEQEQKDLRFSTQCMRVLEELSAPVVLQRVNIFDKKSLRILVGNLAQVYPNLAQTYILRSGNKENIDSLFSRKALTAWTREQSDEFLEGYRQLLEETMNPDSDVCKTKLHTETMMTVIPEIMSRLVTKSSFETRVAALKTIGMYYASNYKGRVVGVSTLVNRLMNSFNHEEQQKILPYIIGMPFPDHYPHYENVLRFDPVTFADIDAVSEVEIDKKTIAELLHQLGEEGDSRMVAFCRLNKLFHIGLLDEEQKAKFGEQLWSKTDEKSGFPANIPYYDHIYLQLPHPDSVDVEGMLRQYFFDTPFANEKNGGVAMTRGEFTNWNVILGATSMGYVWKQDEIRILVNDIIGWWHKFKKRLSHKEEASLLHSIPEEYEYRMLKIIAILSRVIRPNWDLVAEEQKVQLDDLVNDSRLYTNHHLSLQAILSSEKTINGDYTEDIIESVSSTEEREVRAGGLAVQYMAVRGIFEKSIIDSVTCFFRYGKIVGMSSILTTLAELSNRGWQPDAEQQRDLYFGLNHLYKSTQIGQYDSELDVEDKLLIRQKCVEMSSVIKQKVDVKDGRLSSMISQWLKEAENENEFCEIRNAIEEKNGI